MAGVIRRGVEADLPGISALYGAVLREQVVWGLTGAPLAVDRWPDGILLVATDQATVVGFAFGFHEVDAPLAVFGTGEAYFEVAEVFVRADRRGAGLGGRLLNELLGAARAAGEQRFSVFSATKDQPGIRRFYERSGFIPWGTQFYAADH